MKPMDRTTRNVLIITTLVVLVVIMTLYLLGIVLK